MKQNNKNQLNEKKGTPRNRSSVPAVGCVSGFTLVEVLISVLIIMVLVTGAMAYQYHSTHDVKLAEIHAGAARVSMLLLEGWKGAQGTEDFDPVSTFTQLTIAESAYGPEIPDDRNGDSLTLLGYYEVQIQNTYYYITLSWCQASEPEPKVLNVTTAWRGDYGQGELEGNEAWVRYSTFCVDN